MVTKKQEKEDERRRCIRQLRKWLRPGKTVYTVLRHVSRSGMMRHISAYVVVKGEMVNISYYASKVLDWPMNEDNSAVKVSGCGMDMGFHLVYSLSHALFPKGFKTWDGYWRNGPLAFEPDGGYALRQSWT